MSPKNSRDRSGYRPKATPQSGRWSPRRAFRRREAHLITDAKLSPGQDRHRREVVYSILQFLRVPSLLVGGALIYFYDAWLVATLIIGVTFPLPWIAVVIGNGKGQPKDKREKNVYKPALARQMAQAQAQQIANQQRRAIEDQPVETIDHDIDFDEKDPR
ncbi:DUF3099 domain-containing protein [Corynebacterium striatum]|uniref:DUF3099 domain-containing protein n=1 Tax=Corynebacterium striatum TaxID=43770 RepID=UPI00254DCBCC|nr:DUF3099 domain-containing protein [Corynebacterium striatum]MDK8824548.1 DUF3099 domain-containing protein [Corynebacterium striatum]